MWVFTSVFFFGGGGAGLCDGGGSTLKTEIKEKNNRLLSIKTVFILSQPGNLRCVGYIKRPLKNENTCVKGLKCISRRPRPISVWIGRGLMLITVLCIQQMTLHLHLFEQLVLYGPFLWHINAASSYLLS